MSIELILTRGQHQLRRLLDPHRRPDGQVFACWCDVAAAEAPSGWPSSWFYFRNRGSIAVEDINLMKG